MDIKRLLLKHMTDTITPEEYLMLMKWVDESPEHQAYFDKISNRSNYSELYVAYKKRGHSERQSRFLSVWRNSWARAAVITIPILIASAVISFYMTKQQPVADVIIPGTSRAVLSLSNGNTYELGDSPELGWLRIDEDLMITEENGVIAYDYKSETSPELSDYSNTIKTPRGGEFRVVLPDGTKVHLNALSELTYPLAFGNDNRVVKLSGEAYFEVAHDSKRPFLVETNGITIKQFGTRFNVNSYSMQNTIVTLEQGSIGVSTGGVEFAMVKPGECAVWNKGANSVAINKVDDPLEVCGWHYNRFVFNEASLGEMMETLSLWYDMEVRFQQSDLANLQFTGNLSRYEDINTIFKAVEKVAKVRIKVEGRRVMISFRN